MPDAWIDSMQWFPEHSSGQVPELLSQRTGMHLSTHLHGCLWSGPQVRHHQPHPPRQPQELGVWYHEPRIQSGNFASIPSNQYPPSGATSTCAFLCLLQRGHGRREAGETPQDHAGTQRQQHYAHETQLIDYAGRCREHRLHGEHPWGR